jgi:hypothetical protein
MAKALCSLASVLSVTAQSKRTSMPLSPSIVCLCSKIPIIALARRPQHHWHVQGFRA